MSDWLRGLISGVIATVIGFGLTMVWDVWKDRRQTTQRDEAVSRAVANDLEANLKSIDANLRALTEEVRVLPEGKTVVQPLAPMKLGFWEVAKINPPEQLITSGKLGALADLLQRCDALNQVLQSRETYRMHNESMTNFHGRMGTYDQIALQAMRELKNLITAYQQAGVQ